MKVSNEVVFTFHWASDDKSNINTCAIFKVKGINSQVMSVLFVFLLKVWFDRRTNYTRSLAVMSMVGYVLGLGDRSDQLHWLYMCSTSEKLVPRHHSTPLNITERVNARLSSPLNDFK